VVEALAHPGIIKELVSACALLFVHLDHLAAPAEILAQPEPFGRARLGRLRFERLRHVSQHAGVDAICLGASSGCAGKVPGISGIDANKGVMPQFQLCMQRLINTAGRFEHNKLFGIQAVEPGCNGHSVVFDLEVTRSLTVKNVECRFGNIDANGKLVQGHGACPCDTGSMATAQATVQIWCKAAGDRARRRS
jgi:hypothetical protein